MKSSLKEIMKKLFQKKFPIKNNLKDKNLNRQSPVMKKKKTNHRIRKMRIPKKKTEMKMMKPKMKKKAKNNKAQKLIDNKQMSDKFISLIIECVILHQGRALTLLRIIFHDRGSFQEENSL